MDPATIATIVHSTIAALQPKGKGKGKSKGASNSNKSGSAGSVPVTLDANGVPTSGPLKGKQPATICTVKSCKSIHHNPMLDACRLCGGELRPFAASKDLPTTAADQSARPAAPAAPKAKAKATPTPAPAQPSEAKPSEAPQSDKPAEPPAQKASSKKWKSDMNWLDHFHGNNTQPAGPAPASGSAQAAVTLSLAAQKAAANLQRYLQLDEEFQDPDALTTLQTKANKLAEESEATNPPTTEDALRLTRLQQSTTVYCHNRLKELDAEVAEIDAKLATLTTRRQECVDSKEKFVAQRDHTLKKIAESLAVCKSATDAVAKAAASPFVKVSDVSMENLSEHMVMVTERTMKDTSLLSMVAAAVAEAKAPEALVEMILGRQAENLLTDAAPKDLLAPTPAPDAAAHPATTDMDVDSAHQVVDDGKGTGVGGVTLTKAPTTPPAAWADVPDSDDDLAT